MEAFQIHQHGNFPNNSMYIGEAYCSGVALMANFILPRKGWGYSLGFLVDGVNPDSQNPDAVSEKKKDRKMHVFSITTLHVHVHN